jgi:hypothetical protein
MSTKEIWKDIPEYEGYYQVSNLGNVRSLDRLRKNGIKGQYLTKGRILSPSKSNYKSVVLSVSGVLKSIRVHQLVAIAFLNHNPCRFELVVNHINLDKHDNRLENLEIITNRENSNQKHINSTSKFTGVHLTKHGKWKGQIVINGKQEHLGYFDCELAAAKAYKDKLKEIDGNLKSFLNVEL